MSRNSEFSNYIIPVGVGLLVWFGAKVYQDNRPIEDDKRKFAIPVTAIATKDGSVITGINPRSELDMLQIDGVGIEDYGDITVVHNVSEISNLIIDSSTGGELDSLIITAVDMGGGSFVVGRFTPDELRYPELNPDQRPPKPRDGFITKYYQGSAQFNIPDQIWNNAVDAAAAWNNAKFGDNNWNWSMVKAGSGYADPALNMAIIFSETNFNNVCNGINACGYYQFMAPTWQWQGGGDVSGRLDERAQHYMACKFMDFLKLYNQKTNQQIEDRFRGADKWYVWNADLEQAQIISQVYLQGMQR